MLVMPCLLMVCHAAWTADSTIHSPRLLLTPARLKRLGRDRQRQTIRWANFEKRVESVRDSPGRGFELALYYAVTNDEERGREAVAWALGHPAERRQDALVVDWCAALLTPEDLRKLTHPDKGAAGPQHAGAQSAGSQPVMEKARDDLFEQVANGNGAVEHDKAEWKGMLAALEAGEVLDARNLYALCEYLAVVRSSVHADLRQEDPTFFSRLPVEFLLSMRPEKVRSPDWLTHAAALALVELDPNLEGSQFLQSWAVEEGQMVQEGPGVAYELLWADPYLPGVGYQNMQPWVYDSNGRLFARSSWDAGACWISVSSRGVQEENCPSGWQNGVNEFGRMTLLPATNGCARVPHRKNMNDTMVVWKLTPERPLYYFVDKQRETAQTDSAGIWYASTNVEGNVCANGNKPRRP